MSPADEKDARDSTVAMSPEDLPSPDPGATRPVEAPVARPVVPDDLPTIVVPPREAESPADGSGAVDGIDAMGDTYFAPAAAEDLTSPQAPVTIESPVQSLPERRRRLPRWAVVLLVLLVAAAAAGAAWYAYDQEVWGGKTVPPVVGSSQEEAVETLEDLGFVVNLEPVLADEGFDVVLSSDPAEGERVDPAAGITLTVATRRTVPEVVGLSAERAQAALYEAGAQNISIAYQSSSNARDTVLSVSPAEGEAFLSADVVTLIVARPYTVPAVLGLPMDQAREQLAEAGLSSTVTCVESDEERGTVLSVSPEVGAEVAEGATVELTVASPVPSSPHDLLAYFEAIPQVLPGYLEGEGFELRHGNVYVSGGNADAGYESADGDVLRITDYPETGHVSETTRTDVLSAGAGVGGVRYSFSAATVPEGGATESESGVRAVMEVCGLEGLVETCTQDTIALPERPEGEGSGDGASDDAGADRDYHYICGYGRQGDYVWAVIIGGYGESSGVTALAAPASHFTDADLTDFGGSLCSYIAYVDLYTG